jgi:flagellar assembly factor FliW
MTASCSDPSIREGLTLKLPMSVTLLGGLAPFTCEKFTLVAVEEAPPFFRLDAEGQDLAFHLLDPFLVLPDYEPEISDLDDHLLELHSPEDSLVLSIVNLNGGQGDPTVNLAAPIIVNVRTGRGKQTILNNATKYAVRHKLPLT